MFQKLKKPLSAEVFLCDEDEVSEELMTIGDTLTIPTQRTFRDSGEMIAPCTIARTGVMLYRAKDLGNIFADRDPMDIIKVMTTEEELFATDSLESYRSCPITVSHPRDENGNQVDVSLENNKQLQKGMLEGLPLRDENGELAGVLVVNDQDTIKLIDDGYDQLSSGHKATVVRVTGKEWDAEKTKIRANHIAIVKKGRAGTARIADEDDIATTADKVNASETKLTDAALEAKCDELQTRISVVTSENQKLKVDLQDTKDALAIANDKLSQATASLSQMEIKLSDEVSKNISETEMSRRVEEFAAGRLRLLSCIAKLGDDFEGLEINGKSEIEIKREVLGRLRDEDFSNKTDQYIEARFDMALEDSSEITLSDALSTSMLSNEVAEPKVHVNPAAAAKQRRLERYNK